MKDKIDCFEKAARVLQQLQFTIIQEDRERPWGGFFVIDEKEAERFAKEFFREEDFSQLNISGKLSPKFLIVLPGVRLSWQYHHRRAEIWKCILGKAAVATSFTDKEENSLLLNTGDIIKLQQLERHRLIGLEDWALIAEIWQHTDAQNPSDENDIVRLQDDFGR